MIMIVKTPGSQIGSPAGAEEGGEEVGGGRWESGERSEVQARSTLTAEMPRIDRVYEFAQWKNLEIFHVFCYVWYKYLNF